MRLRPVEIEIVDGDLVAALSQDARDQTGTV